MSGTASSTDPTPPARQLRPVRGYVVTGGVLLTLAAVLTIIVWRAPGEPWVQDIDDEWRARVLSVRGAIGTSTATFLSVAGGWPWAYLAVALAAVTLAVLRRFGAALFVVGTVLLTSVVVIPTMKLAVERTRPPAHLVDVAGYSFPSGHAAFAAAIAGSLAIVATRRRAWWLCLAVVGTIVMMISRTYLSVHWLSDTVAGAAIGFAIVLLGAASAVTLSNWARRRAAPELPPSSA